MTKTKKPKIHHLTFKDFESVLEKNLSPLIRQKIKQAGFTYRKLDSLERDQCFKKIVEALQNPNIVRAGKHRQKQWEKGWGENAKLFDESQNEDDILPRYFGKYQILRWKQEFIEAYSARFESQTLAIITDWLFEKYVKNLVAIYEFGCGTGHHLLRFRQISPEIDLYGLDWAKSSQRLINSLAKKRGDQKMYSHRFDFFNPDDSIKLQKDSAILTVAALEQVGDGFQPFVNFLLKNKPKFCIHIEPIAELLDSESNLLDFLSVEYFKKRNYLNGFLTHLQKLEKKKKIKIHLAKRTYIGSLYIEGYSVIVWSPL